MIEKIQNLNDMIERQLKICQELEYKLNNWIHVNCFDPSNPLTAKAAEKDEKEYKVIENELFNQKQLYQYLIELRETRKESRTIAEDAYKRGFQDGKEAAILAKPVYIYKTVRSYTDNCEAQNRQLVFELKNGFEFVRASEVVKNSGNKCDYIEYILRKEIGGL